MIVGGEPIGQRSLKWNFVHASPDRIRQAGQDWVDGKFAGIAGDPEFIPLPEDFFSED
jgi:hypothetical protein